MVPKGFLRFYVLKLLSEKPMSGSEIMQEIENMTSGNWRPSPGSIYPLMSGLQDEGYTKEVPTEEVGIKRYTLTDQGKKLLEEHIKRKEEIRKRFRFFHPSFGTPFLDFFWSEIDSKGARELRNTSQKLLKAIWDLRENLRERYSKSLMDEAKAVLENAAEKIDEINKELQSQEKSRR